MNKLNTQPKNYSILLFDLDNTLLSFDSAEEAAFKLTMEKLKIQYDQDFFEDYKIINTAYWQKLERKEITLDLLGPSRFADLFKKYSIICDSFEANKTYFDFLQYQHQPMKQMKEVLTHFADKHIYVVTNGQDYIQHRRYIDSGLNTLTKGIFISQELGIQKPDIRFFERMNKSIQGNKKDMLLIGDSLSSDIQGGINYGIDTCFFNKKDITNSKIQPTYQIYSLTDLYNIVK